MPLGSEMHGQVWIFCYHHATLRAPESLSLDCWMPCILVQLSSMHVGRAAAA